jgi:hypothetical protein
MTDEVRVERRRGRRDDALAEFIGTPVDEGQYMLKI